MQEKQITALYDGYYALRNDGEPTVITIAPPIEIYHPVFSDFLRNVRNQNYQPTTEAIRIVCDLISTAGAIYNKEQSRSKDYRKFIGDLLDQSTTELNRAASDGFITTQLIDCLVPLVALELKNALGEGGFDTLIQAELSVFNLWSNDEARTHHPSPIFCPYNIPRFPASATNVVAPLSSSRVVVPTSVSLELCGLTDSSSNA